VQEVSGLRELHLQMLQQALKCLSQQMIAANGGALLRISGL
jgi:hypothetical protein